MEDYVCKIATIDEMETKWNYEIKKNKGSNWKIWKAEAIERVKNNQSIAYYGILNGKIICETTAMLDKNIVQNYEGLVDDKTIYLCAFRTIEKYQGKGHFSELFHFMINDLKSRGYEKVTLGVEPEETKSLKIYKHLGFNEIIKSAQEVYPDGTVIDVDYYAMVLD
ncbi:MAG: GNAT family N-acetyltransferase [Eubacterium sp.]|nr:GNAT family N-acetyltransferase [Eubacterium sp.]